MLHDIASQDWLGCAAASLTTLSLVPQAVLTLRTRRVEGISPGMFSLFTLGVLLWLAYGWQLGEWPMTQAAARAMQGALRRRKCSR